MPDDVQPTNPVEPEQENDGNPTAEQNGEQAPTKEPSSDSIESLPDSWQNEIRSLRAENARRRTSENDLKAKVEEALSEDDVKDAVTKAVADYQAKVEELERTLAFERHTKGLSDEAKELVTGSTEEEIQASADKVRRLVAAATPEPTPKEPDLEARSGLSDPEPGAAGGKYDSRALARAAREQNRLF